MDNNTLGDSWVEVNFCQLLTNDSNSNNDSNLQIDEENQLLVGELLKEAQNSSAASSCCQSSSASSGFSHSSSQNVDVALVELSSRPDKIYPMMKVVNNPINSSSSTTTTKIDQQQQQSSPASINVGLSFRRTRLFRSQNNENENNLDDDLQISASSILNNYQNHFYNNNNNWIPTLCLSHSIAFLLGAMSVLLFMRKNMRGSLQNSPIPID